jgi:hypothetical protein
LNITRGNALQFRHPDRLPAGESMAGAHRQHQLFLEQCGRLHPVAIHGQDDHGEIDLALFQAADQILRAGLVEGQLQRRMLGVERGQHRWKQVGRETRCGPNRKAAAL